MTKKIKLSYEDGIPHMNCTGDELEKAFRDGGMEEMELKEKKEGDCGFFICNNTATHPGAVTCEYCGEKLCSNNCYGWHLVKDCKKNE